MPTIAVINFENLGGLVFSGRERGAAMREKFKLDQLDRQQGEVEIIMNDEIFTISSSFFLGMFGDSIRNAGSKNAFLSKYIFVIPERFTPTIERGINRALNII